jgi:hypothetical protein
MPPSEIPTDHHFARLVGGSKIVNNEDGSGREALTPDAFRMRPDEDALSGSYFENAGSNEPLNGVARTSESDDRVGWR